MKSSVIDLTPARLRVFLREIEKPAGEFGCWVWRGAANDDGYPVFSGAAAHRVSYEWLVGPISEGLELDHVCRTQLCVNPHHLEPVTRSENLLRIRRYGPFEIRGYCLRNNHPLTNATIRRWSNGKAIVDYCYLCHLEREARKKVAKHGTTIADAGDVSRIKSIETSNRTIERAS